MVSKKESVGYNERYITPVSLFFWSPGVQYQTCIKYTLGV